MKSKNNIKIEKINTILKQTKIKIIIGLILALIIVIGLFLFLGSNKAMLSKGHGAYFCKGEKDKQSFDISEFENQGLEKLTTLPLEKIDPDKYRIPKHIYISPNKKNLIYFEKTEEIPVGTISKEKGLVAVRILYQPQYVNLKTGSKKEIDQKIDSGSLVFSSTGTRIAWIKRVEEATMEKLQESNKQRELWTSDLEGKKAKKIADLNEKVVLLQRWNGNYVYFWGLKSVGSYGLGRVNINTGFVEHVLPKYCSEELTNCQNFRFSSSGELFIYEAGIKKEEEGQITSLFVESFDGEQSWKILVDNYISDRLWIPDEKGIIYTEQAIKKKGEIEEIIHLVDLDTKEDKKVYSGSYISQITPSKDGQYLYFIEKESDEIFNLIKLNIQTQETEVIDSSSYEQIKLISSQ